MRRAGGWVLGAVVVAAMAGGAWVAFRPILNRQTLRIGYVVRPDARPPSNDAMISGARFAIEEAGGKVKGYRIEFYAPMGPKDPPADILISLDDHHLLHAEFPDKPRGEADPPEQPTLYFHPLANLQDQGKAAAAWAQKINAQRPVVLFDKENPASEEVCLGFVHAPVYNLQDLKTLDTAGDREQLLQKVMAAKPDLVFYAGESAPYSTAQDLFDALRKRGFTGPLLTADADPEVSYLAVPHRIVEGAFLVSLIRPPSKEFAAAYEPATGRHAGPHAWPAYCTLKAVLEVIEKTGASGKDSLRRTIRSHRWGGQPCALYLSHNGKFEYVCDLK